MAERGIEIGKTTGFQMRIPSHFWGLWSESHEGSREFSQHLDWLLDTLMPAKAKLNAIALAPGTRMQCDGVVWVSDDGVNVKLGLAQMKQLLDLGLELHLQFAVYGADG